MGLIAACIHSLEKYLLNLLSVAIPCYALEIKRWTGWLRPCPDGAYRLLKKMGSKRLIMSHLQHRGKCKACGSGIKAILSREKLFKVFFRDE